MSAEKLTFFLAAVVVTRLLSRHTTFGSSISLGDALICFIFDDLNLFLNRRNLDVLYRDDRMIVLGTLHQFGNLYTFRNFDIGQVQHCLLYTSDAADE